MHLDSIVHCCDTKDGYASCMQWEHLPSQPAPPVGYLVLSAHTVHTSSTLHLEHEASPQADKNEKYPMLIVLITHCFIYNKVLVPMNKSINLNSFFLNFHAISYPSNVTSRLVAKWSLWGLRVSIANRFSDQGLVCAITSHVSTVYIKNRIRVHVVYCVLPLEEWDF